MGPFTGRRLKETGKKTSPDRFKHCMCKILLAGADEWKKIGRHSII